MQLFRITIIALVLFFLSPRSYGQVMLSANVKTLIDSGRRHFGKEQQIIFLNQAMAASQNTHDSGIVMYNMVAYYYVRDTAMAINICKQAYTHLSNAKQYKLAAITLSNLAFIYEEKKGNIDSAVYYSNQSIQMCNTIKDTAQAANMHKYKGLLFGMKGAYTEAKKEIDSALLLYGYKADSSGMMVSYNNLGRIYAYAKQYDSALHYLHIAKSYWLSQRIKSRVFNINNTILGLVVKTHNDTLTNSLLTENKKLLTEVGVTHTDELAFYKTGYDYHFMKGNAIEAEDYLVLYNTLIIKLKQKGICVK